MLAHPTDGSDGIKEGIHLRWASHYKLGFPKSGYKLYRKKSQKKNYHCFSVKDLENLNPKGRKKSKYFLDIKLPEESSHLIINYNSPKTDFKVLAYNNKNLLWENSIKGKQQKDGQIDIVSGQINRIAIIAKYVEITSICYWTCSGDGWELINHECGFGLPFDAIIDEKLHKRLTAISKDPCDPYWGMAICRLGHRNCNLKGQNFQDLKDMISGMAGEGIVIPIGWNDFNVEEEGHSCEEEISPDFGITPYDSLLTQSINPEIAMILGLYWIDKRVEDRLYYDYKVEAEWDEKALFKLEYEFTFGEEDTAKSYFPIFRQSLRKGNALFQGTNPRILNVSSSLAKVKKGIAFDYPNDSRINIIFDKPVKEVQIFIQQKGLKTKLRAYSYWFGGPVKESILSRKEGILSVHGDSIKHLVLEGEGVVLLRLHYDFEELQRGQHSFCICGIKKLIQEKPAVPKGLTATCLRGAVTDVDENYYETEYRFRAGLRWEYIGDLNTGLLTNGPIGYFVNRLDPRGNNEILNEGDPIFVIPEEFGDEENQLEIHRISDCSGKDVEERPYYNDAVLEKGIYKYKVQSFDIFGRKSNYSEEVPVELKPPPPPPPINVRAKFLDYDSYDPEEDFFKDPSLLIEEKQWLLENKTNGFLIKWSWPDNLQKQAPDSCGFKIRFCTGWLNVYQGKVKEVVTDTEIKTTLTFNPNNPLSENILINEWIKIGAFTYKISSNTAGNDPVLILEELPESLELPEDIKFETGAHLTLSVSKAIQEGGAAINYNDPGNWDDPFSEHIIEVPSDSEYNIVIPMPNSLKFPDYLNEKTVYGQIAINTYSEDSEGSMSTPATVMAVNRQSPPAPVINYPDGETLKTTKADFYGKSTYELNWPVNNSLRYDIFRCMDQTLFMVDKRNRTNRDSTLYDDVIEQLAPTPIDEALFSDPELNYATLIIEGKYNLLRALACLEDNGEAFGKLNDKPLKDVSKYTDKSIDGRSNNLYFYKIRPIDEIGNQGEFSLATAPVECPKVTAPVAPVITKIVGGQKQITVKWSGNPGSDIAGYLVYRTDVKSKARDWRKMELVKANESNEYSVIAGDPLELVDRSIKSMKPYWYGVVAVAEGVGGLKVKSKMNAIKIGQAFDIQPPEPPVLQNMERITVDGEMQNRLLWSSDEQLQYLVQRRVVASNLFISITSWLNDSIFNSDQVKWSYSITDEIINSENVYKYRLKVKSQTGNLNVSEETEGL